MFHISALLFAWLEFSWPVALAMTLALLMFIYGMYRYWLRIYNRFALSSDRMITGKFEFGAPPPPGSSGGGTSRDVDFDANANISLSEVLTGGISSIASHGSAAERAARQMREARQIIDVVEPKARPVGSRPATGVYSGGGAPVPTPASNSGTAGAARHDSEKCTLS
eukprot:scaffold155241_cov28-Tisochrysis_lutea.AAC.2